MVQFSRLKLQGFKSFIDKTELDIGAGLNGVVGPNGCGKSNLVEALRWVMGESSAKRMRGDGMEDVIFNGTKSRTARNLAEVSLLLDNTDRKAPALYNGADEIEITRKIERDKGSSYRINGKLVRARDVQMFFADSVSGANSPALVSQGRVTEIIKAKPAERRLILEDSAGISGLFVRRHEAELKLRAADNNLQRIDDIYSSLEARLSALKRQVQQAEKYRGLSAQIRQLDLVIAHLEYERAQDKLRTANHAFKEAETIVAEKMTTVTQLTKMQVTQSEDLPLLRRKEAEYAAALQAHKVALQRLEDEHKHQQQMHINAREQVQRLTKDQERETASIQETQKQLETLEQEQTSALTHQQDNQLQCEVKKEEAQTLKQQLIQLEERYNNLMKSVAEKKARRVALENQLKQNQTRLETLEKRHRDHEEKLTALEKTDSGAGHIAEKESQITQNLAQKEALSAQLETYKNTHDTLRTARDEAQNHMQIAQATASALQSEVKILQQFFTQKEEAHFEAVLDQISAQEGFEVALARALGDTVMAALDTNAPIYWADLGAQNLENLLTLPHGATPLSDVVNAPAQLSRALSQIGFVEDRAALNAAMPSLKAGQALVSADGLYARWDGLTIQGKAQDRSAIHLQQKNKLAQLEADLPPAQKEAQSAQENLDKSKQALRDNDDCIQGANQNLRTLEQSISALQIAIAQDKEKRARLDSQIEHLKSALSMSSEDIKTAQDQIKWDQQRLTALSEDESAQQQERSVETMHKELTALREKTSNATRDYDRALQMGKTLEVRIRALGDEKISVKNRNIRAREYCKEIETALAGAQDKLREVEANPILQDENAQQTLHDKIAQASNARDKAAENLARVESEVAQTTRALKTAENIVNDQREKRAHAQALVASAQDDIKRQDTLVQEKFSCPCAALRGQITLDIQSGSISTFRTEKERLTLAREKIGPVNLRADEEYKELNDQVSEMIREREDLLAAINELRSAVNTINTEARERLIAAFDKVNAHFQNLFEQLFVGGSAKLELVGSEDPLEAGLEIFAQPPGKALQSLTLLSGGEQTMASIALIFGMFLTNPSPICVLDEIDAPLDDANVDRVCNLLDTIAARGETRFIVITHHRLTMARMNRLYGVTMQERGISQLVSVDLQQSFDFVEAA